jgi:hypothetical protein
MPYRCIDNLGGKIVLYDASPDEAAEYIRNYCDEWYELPPDSFVFRETTFSPGMPLLAGIVVKKRKIILPFLKRCSGICLVEITARKGDFLFVRQFRRDG